MYHVKMLQTAYFGRRERTENKQTLLCVTDAENQERDYLFI
jgi:hypothetical protein